MDLTSGQLVLLLVAPFISLCWCLVLSKRITHLEGQPFETFDRSEQRKGPFLHKVKTKNRITDNSEEAVIRRLKEKDYLN